MHFNSYICILSFNIKVHNYSKAFQAIFHINAAKKLTKIDNELKVLSSISNRISFIYTTLFFLNDLSPPSIYMF